MATERGCILPEDILSGAGLPTLKVHFSHFCSLDLAPEKGGKGGETGDAPAVEKSPGQGMHTAFTAFGATGVVEWFRKIVCPIYPPMNFIQGLHDFVEGESISSEPQKWQKWFFAAGDGPGEKTYSLYPPIFGRAPLPEKSTFPTSPRLPPDRMAAGVI